MSDLLHYLGNCPLCNRRLRAERATVIERAHGLVMASVDCQNCWASLVLTIISSRHFPLPEARKTLASLGRTFVDTLELSEENDVVTLLGMVTDLTASDAKKLSREPRLTFDDVLELHEYFAKQVKRKT